MATPAEQRRALGRVVRERRVALGLSRSDAAAAWSVPTGWLSRLERGEADPALSRLIGLSAAMAVAPSALLRRVEELIEESS